MGYRPILPERKSSVVLSPFLKEILGNHLQYNKSFTIRIEETSQELALPGPETHREAFGLGHPSGLLNFRMGGSMARQQMAF